MAQDGIFLVHGSNLEVLQQQPYETEDLLQRALAEHPEVIAGPTTSGDESRALLLVKREMGVPGVAGGGPVWSLDHLFIDATGVPVVVEVKRSSDTRIRREVVGQMLDYAANGVKYWPVASLRQAVEEDAAQRGVSADDLIAALAPEIDPEEFWRTVEANLTAGRIRMLFVADALPPELVRIIEFLNEQMGQAEVLGVELRQYVGDGQIVYVPRVVGRTSVAVAAKGATGGQLWNRETFLEAARARRPAAEVELIESLLADVAANGSRLGWGKAATPGVSGWYVIDGQPAAVWNLNVNSAGSATGAYMYFYFSDLARRSSLEVIERAARILEQIEAFEPKIAEARANAWNKYPSAYLRDLVTSAGDVQKVLDAIAVLVGHHD